MAIAILLRENIVIGYNFDIAACVNAGVDFIELDEVPQAFNELQPNQQMRYENGTFIVSTLPPQPPSEFDLLKQQVEELAITLADHILGGP